MRRAFLLALLAVAACKETRQVKLTFGASSRVPLGFQCRDDTNHLLGARALDRADLTVRMSLLVDFVGLGGVPSCRATDIAAFCAAHACTPLTDPPRVCFDLSRKLAVGEETTATVIAELVRAGLSGKQVTDDAPDAPVIIRAVGSAQSCAELAGGKPYDTSKLVGCALSCPVLLDAVEGDILLDLPTLSDRCEPGVIVCATGEGLFKAPQ